MNFMHIFLEQTTGSAEGGGLMGGMGGMLLMMVALLGVMYLFTIRPENKRKKEAENMRNSIKVGDKVTTIGGMVGSICHIKEDRVVIETSADRVRVEFLKSAIQSNDTANERARAEAEKLAAARKREREERKAAKGKR